MLHVARDASQQNVSANGRYGSESDLSAVLIDVRSTPKARHRLAGTPGLKNCQAIIRKVQQDEGARMGMARRESFADGVTVQFFAFV
jgi:hypothetical protein